MAPQSKGGQKLQKTTIEHYQGRFLNTQKVHFMLFCFLFFLFFFLLVFHYSFSFALQS
jgi:hypothetical protein